MGVKKTPRRFNKEQVRQIEGRNPIREALRAGTPLTKVLIEESVKFDDRITEIYNLAKQKEIPVERVYTNKLRKLSKTSGHHQGVIAMAELEEEVKIEEILKFIEKENRLPFFIILADVLYEQNLGAVLRTAESAGVDAVIVNKRAPLLTPVVERAAVGAGEYVPLIHTNLFTTLDLFKKNGIKIFGAIEGNNKSLYRCDFQKGVAIIIGAEDKGITDPIAKQIDEFISIPMLGRIESLNMSVAAALILYEVVRQRKYNK